MAEIKVSYEKKFGYPNKDNVVTNRDCFVMRENETSFDGLELTYLSEDEANQVREVLKNHPIKDFTPGDKTIEGYNTSWGKAWRRYSKLKVTDTVTEDYKSPEEKMFH